jgi:hypothetical protein
MDLPAAYVADPLAIEHVPCPYCWEDMLVTDIDTVGGSARRVLYCDPCHVRLHQEPPGIDRRRSGR